MFSSLIHQIKVLTLGESHENGGDEESIIIPQVKTCMTTTPPEATLMDTPTENAEIDIEHVECIGIISALDDSMQMGIIDNKYQFSTTKFCSGFRNPFVRGTKVEFEAERSRLDPRWTVTSMKPYESTIQKMNKERGQFRKVIAKVKFANKEKIEVEAGKDKLSQRVITIPNKREFYPGYLWMRGDWMQVHLKRLDSPDDCEEDDELPGDLTNSVVLSVAPLQTKTLVGKITRRDQNFLIDNSIYFTQNLCRQQLPLGTVVKCTAIQSTQRIGGGVQQFVNWRAVKMEKSNVPHYTAPDEEEIEWIDEAGKEAVIRFEELALDKCGIKIFPRSVRFPTMQVGTTGCKTVTISNTTNESHKLKEIKFQQDPSVCHFEIKPTQHRIDKDITIAPKDEIKFEITCKPLIIGKTTEMCVFHFDGFTIAREVSVIGQSEEEISLGMNASSARPQFQPKSGNIISKVLTDQNRRRVKGIQSIRGPFFAQKRLPSKNVPEVLYHILRSRDEDELLRMYPNAKDDLTLSNYREKFMVGLWFEEIECQLRRRQYDMHNVRLKRHGGQHSTFYTFQVPGMQDFQPQVNVQDTIDAFDPESPSNAKFQGTITKIFDSEVTCVFGDAFNEQYCGFPLTIQFNLSRSSLRRCHFASEVAVNYLGEAFLFPTDEIRVKPARILTYEEDKDKPTSLNTTQEDQKDTTKDHGKPTKSTIFSKALPKSKYRGSGQGGSRASDNHDFGRRVQSTFSNFVSDTASSPSCTDAKLEWFNVQLNLEQKDAVRHILRGVARPLPYIIYGPPGTGKTVTLVEAVMQLNKLDKNSRVLVCASSNAAADIIAEYLANSNQYVPGDFIRFNGFLRAGQNLPETIYPFCVDGEDLHNVAMHRLIVSTCITAGQFFSLDLSIGHLTHVFIDEAGYCTEPEAMVPAILLALSKGGQLILVGDPNQLGPVLMSDVSINCGLDKSLLQRLMEMKLYSRDPVKFPKEKYNPHVLTKLVRNYRAHAVLLKIPSELFYDNDLQPEASWEEAYALCEDPSLKPILVTEKVPLIFHGVQGACLKERDSPSWCNLTEAVQVAHYVVQLIGKCALKPEDIGIITPYRKQVDKIREALRLVLIAQSSDEFPKVASVEEFQGGERKVIIISTVRSDYQEQIDTGLLEKFGFLYQPKRFNVAITRAKALMIVVGNPHVLCRNKDWLKLLTYALELNAYKGCNLPRHLDQHLRMPPSELKLEIPQFKDNIGKKSTEVEYPKEDDILTKFGVDEHEYDCHI